MKVLLLVALVIAAVVAEPEAEASRIGLPYFGPPYEPNYYSNYVRHPYLLHPYGHLLGKRSAEPGADPAVVYQGVSGVYGLSHLGSLGAAHLGHLGYTIGKPTPVSEEAAEDAAKPTVVTPGVYAYPGIYGHALAHPAPVVPAVVTKPEDAKVVVPGVVGHPGYPYAGVLGHSALLGSTHYLVRRRLRQNLRLMLGMDTMDILMVDIMDTPMDIDIMDMAYVIGGRCFAFEPNF